MQKFIPREKLSRKARKALDSQRRAVWAISPVTRKTDDKKKYDRKRESRRQDDPGFFVLVLSPRPFSLNYSVKGQSLGQPYDT